MSHPVVRGICIIAATIPPLYADFN